MSDAVTGLIRTWVPVGVGAFVAWLLAHNITIDPDAQKGLTVAATAVVIAVYYALVRLLESRWPWFGVLLGSTRQPTYAPLPQADPAGSDFEEPSKS